MVNADIKVKIYRDNLLENIQGLRKSLFEYSQFIEETLERIGADDKYKIDDIDNTIERLTDEVNSLISELE